MNGILSAAADNGITGNCDVVQCHVAAADAFGYDKVTGNLHIFERRARYVHDYRSAYVLRICLGFVIQPGNRVVQDGDDFRAGDGGFGIERAVIPLDVALINHRIHRSDSPGRNTGAVAEDGIALRAFVDAQRTRKNDHGFLAGHLIGWANRRAVALNHTRGVGFQNRVRIKGLAKVGKTVFCLVLIFHDAVDDNRHFAPCYRVVRAERSVRALHNSQAAPFFDRRLGPVLLHIRVCS
ncbi:hypothetical protein SDC9_42738 [bioreactor metagenome]|uniref:Uncharacterized protein n=1 Tax=bioreactor metagenome TaxID=1076179 RepID=A0A644VZ09_9ZZZZ